MDAPPPPGLAGDPTQIEEGAMIQRLRGSYAAVTATLALVIALGAGVATAVDRIGSKGIRSDAIKPRHIAVLSGATGEFSGEDVISTGGPQTLITDRFRTEDRGGMLPIGSVRAFGTTGGTVELRILVDGSVRGSTRHEVAAGEVQQITMPTNDGLLKTGKHVVRLQALAGAGDITFESALLNMIGAEYTMNG